MHRCRQLLAAGLLAVGLALPGGAARSAAPLQAARPSNFTAPATAPATANRLYLPFVAHSARAAYDLAPRTVEFVQGVSMGEEYTVYVAGRPALLRLFVDVTGGEAAGVTARLTVYQGGARLGEVLAGPVALAAGAAAEGDFAHTLNFSLPAHWVTAGARYVIELDPHHAVPETNETNNRYPPAGTLAFPVTELAPLEVVVVPVTYARPGGTVTTPPLDDLSYLTWMPERVLPVSAVRYSVRPAPLVFTGDLRTAAGWGDLLGEVNALRATEDPTWNKVYYGLVDTSAEDCHAGCYAGLGFVNSQGRTVYKAAVGYAGYGSNRHAAGPILAHELGHVFGRRHAPCAGASNLDPAYPYAGAAIGHWGYDVATGEVKPPHSKDYMSYCGPAWTSDYTYHGIAAAWGWLNDPFDGGGGEENRLVVSGQVTAGGELTVAPVFGGYAPAAAAEATHRLELVDARGKVLSTTPFAMTELALDTALESAPGDPTGHDHVGAEPAAPLAGFSVAVRPVAGMAGLRIYAGEALVYERAVTGAGPRLAGLESTQAAGAGLSLGWKASGAGHYRVRFSPDGGAAWYLLAADSPTPDVTVPQALLAGATAPLLAVEASDGVRVDTRLFELSADAQR